MQSVTQLLLGMTKQFDKDDNSRTVSVCLFIYAVTS